MHIMPCACTPCSVLDALHASSACITIHAHDPLAGWNVLDFAVVAMGILELTSFGNYTFIRCFRALRPLRAVTKIESLRVSHTGLIGVRSRQQLDGFEGFRYHLARAAVRQRCMAY